MPAAAPQSRISEPRDLGRRLAFLGGVCIAVGVFLVLFGLAHLALPFLTSLIPDDQPTDYGSIAMGLLLYVMLGVALIWAGVGSMAKRRWVRPIMLFVSGTWLIVGAFSLLFVLWMLEDLLVLAGEDLTTNAPLVANVVRVVLVGITFLGGVALPAVLFWAYRDPRIQQTCERHNPEPGWSDRCPTTVLALSAALVAAGLFSLPMLIRPIAPLFGRLVTGWPGGLALMLVAVLCFWLAWTFRLEARGWWATLVFLMVLGLSTAWTFVRVEPVEVYRLMGYPREQLEVLARSKATSRLVTVGSTIALTVLGVLYMLAIRRHFNGAERLDHADPLPPVRN